MSEHYHSNPVYTSGNSTQNYNNLTHNMSVQNFNRPTSIAGPGSLSSAAHGQMTMHNSLSFPQFHNTPNGMIPPPPPQPPPNQHTGFHRMPLTQNRGFTLNPNAPSFRPSYTYQREEPPNYVGPAIYNGYRPPNSYNYPHFAQEQYFVQHMDELNNENVDSMDPAFSNLFFNPSEQFVFSPALSQRIGRSTNLKELKEIQVGLEQMLAEPSESDVWSNAIRERTSASNFSMDSLSLVVEMIAQMAMSSARDRSLQYNLSKLCSSLSRDIQNFEENLLITNLLKFYKEQRTELPIDQLKNLLFFFGEVYEKLKNVTSSATKQFEDALCELIKSFLSRGLDDSIVIAIVQILKLTGRHLDNDRGGCSKVDEILTNLNAIEIAHPAISEDVKKQIRNLSILRESSWGVISSQNRESVNGQEMEQAPSMSSASSYVLGPDGQALSEEERAFLDENIRKLEAGINSVVDENEYSDEYEEFLSNVLSTENRRSVEIDTMEQSLGGINLNDSGELEAHKRTMRD